MAASLYNCIMLGEYVDEKYIDMPSFLRKHGYDEKAASYKLIFVPYMGTYLLTFNWEPFIL